MLKKEGCYRGVPSFLTCSDLSNTNSVLEMKIGAIKCACLEPTWREWGRDGLALAHKSKTPASKYRVVVNIKPEGLLEYPPWAPVHSQQDHVKVEMALEHFKMHWVCLRSISWHYKINLYKLWRVSYILSNQITTNILKFGKITYTNYIKLYILMLHLTQTNYDWVKKFAT